MKRPPAIVVRSCQVVRLLTYTISRRMIDLAEAELRAALTDRLNDLQHDYAPSDNWARTCLMC